MNELLCVYCQCVCVCVCVCVCGCVHVVRLTQLHSPATVEHSTVQYSTVQYSTVGLVL